MKLAVWGLVAVSVLSADAYADPRDPAAAQAMFDAGMSLMKAHDYAKACPKLAESQRLDPGIGTQFQLGVCYEGQGLTASAWAQFLEVASLAGASGQADRQQLARKRAERLEPRLGRVRINVPSTKRVAGLQIERDGALVRDVSWDAALPVDPGEHKITVSAPGHLSFVTKVIVQEGRTSDVDIPLLEEEAEAPPIAPPPSSDERSSPGAASGCSTARRIARARSRNHQGPCDRTTAVIGHGGGGDRTWQPGLHRARRGNRARHHGELQVPGLRSSSAITTQRGPLQRHGVKLRDDSISLANASTAGFIVGGVALSSATVILLMRGAPKQGAAIWAPVTGGRSGGPHAREASCSRGASDGRGLHEESCRACVVRSLVGVHRGARDSQRGAATTRVVAGGYAEPRPGAGGTSSGTRQRQACASTIAPIARAVSGETAAAVPSDCLADSECRTALDAYAKCLRRGMHGRRRRLAPKTSARPDPRPRALYRRDLRSATCEGQRRFAVRALLRVHAERLPEFVRDLGNTRRRCLPRAAHLPTATRTVAGIIASSLHIATAAARHCPHAIALRRPGRRVQSVRRLSTRHVLASARESGFPCQHRNECCQHECPADAGLFAEDAHRMRRRPRVRRDRDRTRGIHGYSGPRCAVVDRQQISDELVDLDSLCRWIAEEVGASAWWCFSNTSSNASSRVRAFPA